MGVEWSHHVQLPLMSLNSWMEGLLWVLLPATWEQNAPLFENTWTDVQRAKQYQEWNIRSYLWLFDTTDQEPNTANTSTSKYRESIMEKMGEFKPSDTMCQTRTHYWAFNILATSDTDDMSPALFLKRLNGWIANSLPTFMSPSPWIVA